MPFEPRFFVILPYSPNFNLIQSTRLWLCEYTRGGLLILLKLHNGAWLDEYDERLSEDTVAGASVNCEKSSLSTKVHAKLCTTRSMFYKGQAIEDKI